MRRVRGSGMTIDQALDVMLYASIGVVALVGVALLFLVGWLIQGGRR